MVKKKKCVYSWDEIPLVVDPAYIAMLLGCTNDLICKLLRAGKIKGFKVGDMWRVKRDDLKTFMEGRETNA